MVSPNSAFKSDSGLKNKHIKPQKSNMTPKLSQSQKSLLKESYKMNLIQLHKSNPILCLYLI